MLNMQLDEENADYAETEEENLRPTTTTSTPALVKAQSMLSVGSPHLDNDTIVVQGPTRQATSYMPGESAFVSSNLLARIKDDLFDEVPYVPGGKVLPGSKERVTCFSGRAAVDSLLAMGYAEKREEAEAVAARIYADGFFRALQPGGFCDSDKHVYRFRGNPKTIQSPPARVRSPLQSRTPQQQRQEQVMFSISSILKSNNGDWLNTSFVNQNSLNDTNGSIVDTTETEEN